MARISSSTTSAAALTASVSREEVIFHNDDTNDAYLLAGSGTASSTDKTLALASGETVCVVGRFAKCAWQVVWAADGSGGLDVTSMG
jgi:hypothetical protein